MGFQGVLKNRMGGLKKYYTMIFEDVFPDTQFVSRYFGFVNEYRPDTKTTVE